MNDFHGWGLVRIAAVGTLSILSLFLLVLTLNAVQDFGHSSAPYSNTITVSGTGKGLATPNIANVYFSITESAGTVAAAQTVATKKGNAALDYLKKQGIDEKDIQASGYNSYPKYENTACPPGVYCPMPNSQKIIGYEVSESITVKIRDTEKVGGILQGLGSLNVTNISGPNFAIDDKTVVQADARGKAIADARQKAEVLASQLGVHLGKVVSFSENGGGPIMYATMGKAGGMMDSATPAPQLPAGQNETDVSVSITYEIR